MVWLLGEGKGTPAGSFRTTALSFVVRAICDGNRAKNSVCDMICYDMIWYKDDDIYAMIWGWYDMIWYTMIWYEDDDMIYAIIWYEKGIIYAMIWYEVDDMIRCMIRYDIWYDMLWYEIYDILCCDMIYMIWYAMIYYIFNSNWLTTRWQ